MANAAIGIKFEVEGGGNINAGSGQLIKQQLTEIANSISANPLQIKFGIDTNYFQREIETLRTTIAKIEKSISEGFGDDIAKSYKEAEEAAKRFYKIQDSLHNASLRNKAVGKKEDGSFYKTEVSVGEDDEAEAYHLFKAYDVAKREMDETREKFLDSVSEAGNENIRSAEKEAAAIIEKAKGTDKLEAAMKGAAKIDVAKKEASLAYESAQSEYEDLINRKQAEYETNTEKREADHKDSEATREKIEQEHKEASAVREAVAAYKEKLKAQKDLFDFTTRSKTVTQKDGTFTLTPNDKENASSIKEGILLYDKYTEAELKATEAAAGLNEEQLKVFESEKKALDDKYVKASVKKIASAEKSWDGLKAKAAQYIQQNQQAFEKTEKSRDKLKELQDLIKNGKYSSFDELKKKLAEAGVYLQENGLLTKSWFDQFKANFSGRVKTILSSMIIGAVTKNIKQIYTNVLEIDTAMTQLKIVTGENEAAFEDFSDTVAKSAKKIGASITDLIESTTTYARLGFSLAESEKYAELTAMYSKVANVDTNEATSNITSIIKAYDVSSDELESVLDKLTWVGNSYAISSAEIGEAMNNAASSLYANGNTLEESIGIVTAANVSLQNVSKASTAVRTIAARISASKTDLEELGEDVTGVSTAKIAKQMKAFGVEIINNNGELKSTYDILADIANKWSDLNSVEKASIAGTLAGKLVPVRTVMCAIEHI